jgi:hypothetical protein
MKRFALLRYGNQNWGRFRGWLGVIGLQGRASATQFAARD